MLRALLKLILGYDWREPSCEHFILVMNFRLHLVLNTRIFKAVWSLTPNFAAMLPQLGDRSSLVVLLSTRLVQPTLNYLWNLILYKEIIFLNTMKVVVFFVKQDFLGARLAPSLTVRSTLETVSVALAPFILFLSYLWVFNACFKTLIWNWKLQWERSWLQILKFVKIYSIPLWSLLAALPGWQNSMITLPWHLLWLRRDQHYQVVIHLEFCISMRAQPWQLPVLRVDRAG